MKLPSRFIEPGRMRRIGFDLVLIVDGGGRTFAGRMPRRYTKGRRSSPA